jgi:hypothetical protein
MRAAVLWSGTSLASSPRGHCAAFDASFSASTPAALVFPYPATG